MQTLCVRKYDSAVCKYKEFFIKENLSKDNLLFLPQSAFRLDSLSFLATVYKLHLYI